MYIAAKKCFCGSVDAVLFFSLKDWDSIIFCRVELVFNEREGYIATDLPIEQQVPCLSTESVSDHELDNIEWDIEDQAVQPYNTGPSPSDATDVGEANMSIDSNQRCHLDNRKA